jgi:hypothetical protein
MGYRLIASRMAEHAPALGSVSSRPGLAAYCGAGLADFVRSAGSVRARPRERGHYVSGIGCPQGSFSMSKSTVFTRHPYRGGLARQASPPARGTMCPFCFATMELIVAGAASTGGLAALAVKRSRQKSKAGKIVPNLNNNKGE